MKSLGADVDIMHGAIVAKADELHGSHIFLDVVSVGATINIKCIGKISGVVTGVLIFTSLTYALTILGIDTNLQFIFEGIIILAAVTLDCLKYVQKK